MASSSKSLSAHHREDLSPTDVMVEESLHNEVRLSKGKRNTYPYPEDLKLEELVPNKLTFSSIYVEWNKRYVEWRQKMLDVITREGLLGYIDGTVEAPPKTVTTSVNGPKGGNTTHKERENEEYVAWNRLDDLVREWFLNRLGYDMNFVSERSETAKGVWEAIAKWGSNSKPKVADGDLAANLAETVKVAMSDRLDEFCLARRDNNVEAHGV